MESVALHALLLRRWPWLSAVLALVNVYTIWWLVRDYQAVAERPTTMGEDALHLRLGKRADAVINWTDVADVSRPTWQEIPGPAVKDYLRLSGSDDPNVLVHLRAPVRFTMMLGARRSARLVGLRLDAPDAFVAAVRAQLTRSRGS